MAVESNQVPAKDAALVIEWDELLERAINQEKFMTNHPHSEKTDQVKDLYDKYLTFILFGLNNTPLFAYDTNQFNDEAKDSYTRAVEHLEGSETLSIVDELLHMLEDSDGMLTDGIEELRNKHTNAI